MIKYFRKNRNLVIEGNKAHQYDEFSHKYRMQDLKEYAQIAANYVTEGDNILDVATGPGYFCIELAKIGRFKISGIDISEDLIVIACENALQAGVVADFTQDDASTMQFPSECFDLVFCSWAMKNFTDPRKVLEEMFRVLKPGGTALIVDLNYAVTTKQWKQYASNRQLKGIVAFFMMIAFLMQRSAAYTKTQFEELIKNTSFRIQDIKSIGINLWIHLCK